MSVHPPYSGITINSARRLLTRNFEAAGLESSVSDVRLLVELATGLSRTEQIARGTELLSSEHFDAISVYAARRIAGEPIDAITGVRLFWKDKFRVTKDVLTPRPETEGIIEAAMALRSSPQSILDLGTGSGAIILSLLREFPDADALATDVSADALRVARGNARDMGLTCNFIVSDWLGAVSGAFDLIVSNPPYITDVAMQALPTEVLNYDPDLALRGGRDGLAPYRIIAAQAQGYLNPDGHLILEIGYDQGAAVAGLLRDHGFDAVTVLQDLAGHDRIVCAQTPTAKNP